jgi:hypothetical protein
MNEQSRELCHRGIEKGYERRNHKYFARIEGNRPGTYRYFYSSAAYDAWKRAKGVASKIGSDLKTFKKYSDYKKQLKKGPVKISMQEWDKLHKDLGDTYLYRTGRAIAKLPIPKVAEAVTSEVVGAVAKFISKQSGKLIPRTYKDKEKRWTEIDKSGRKTKWTSVTMGIEWLNKRFGLVDKRTSITTF